MLTLRKVTALELLFAAATLVVTGIICAQLPERVPIHWNINGQPDGFGSRWSLITLTLLMVAVPPILTFAIPKFPSRDKRLMANDRSFLGIMLTLSGFFSILALVIVYSASNPTLSPTSLVFAVIGLMFAGLGWFMPGIKPNYYAGIRTAWTLASDQVWQETHQRAGPIYVVTGVITAALAFTLPLVAITVLIGGALYPVYDSYRIFKALKSH